MEITAADTDFTPMQFMESLKKGYSPRKPKSRRNCTNREEAGDAVIRDIRFASPRGGVESFRVDQDQHIREMTFHRSRVFHDLLDEQMLVPDERGFEKLRRRKNDLEQVSGGLQMGQAPACRVEYGVIVCTLDVGANAVFHNLWRTSKIFPQPGIPI